MKPQRLIVITSLTTMLFATVIALQPAEAKEWTIYERQVQLMKDVNDALKSGDVTAKEGKNLRHDLANVARKKVKMKGKSDDGEPTIDNKIILEKDLNKISVELKKLSLEKRVKARKAQKEAEKNK
ncbi:MAG: hypothetical protein K8F91_13365 [Candidatus Obscuribacterales bacterium]|nr:hypothetical protein [Candidatus Obscuribacterales bacterium]